MKPEAERLELAKIAVLSAMTKADETGETFACVNLRTGHVKTVSGDGWKLTRDDHKPMPLASVGDA
jgi:hypothetical protein